jgi:hypothetical protein
MFFIVLIGGRGVPQISSVLISRLVRAPQFVPALSVLLTLTAWLTPIKAGVYGLSQHLPRLLTDEVSVP